MSPLVVLVAGLLMVSASTAEAKRARLLPGTKLATAAATPSPAAVAKPSPGAAAAVAGAAVGLRRTITATGAGGASAATAQEDVPTREALRNGAWASDTAVPAQPVRPVSLPNPDARALPVLGIGGGDTRPVKGFKTLN
ncbi:MAG: hypothetical protein NTZ14_06105 [Hyphomicrobiales bacterium]|nr:hypothetical protein [Hyphomicrobiales bacterium]